MPPASTTHARTRPRRGFGAHLRAYFFAGMLVTAPIAITLTIAWWFIRYIDDSVLPLLPTRYNPETYLPFSVPGIGLLVVLAALTLIGMATAGFLGRMLVRMSEGLLARMPVIRSIYGATKQIFDTVFSEKSKAFREVVLVEYPRKGIWCLAFVTGATAGRTAQLLPQGMVNIFLPTTPNPTSGFYLIVPRRDVVPLAMTVEEGAKLVMSGGIVTPPSPAERAAAGTAP
jgi:uncharacterized membrane protein